MLERMMTAGKNTKKNNKGFSLVELIVVILIIAIIAVALAPQVVKYVGTARESVEVSNEATIKSAVQAAVAEYQGQDGVSASSLSAVTYTVAAADSAVTADGSDTNTKGSKSLAALIKENLGSDKLDTSYTVMIKADGTVTVEAK